MLRIQLVLVFSDILIQIKPELRRENPVVRYTVPVHRIVQINARLSHCINQTYIPSQYFCVGYLLSTTSTVEIRDTVYNTICTNGLPPSPQT